MLESDGGTNESEAEVESSESGVAVPEQTSEPAAARSHAARVIGRRFGLSPGMSKLIAELAGLAGDRD
jgi:hypothetical protein